jgi:hypothetical protein
MPITYLVKTKKGWDVYMKDKELDRVFVAGRFEDEELAEEYADMLAIERRIKAPKDLKKKIFKKIK